MDLAQDGANDPTSLPAYDALARHLMEKSGAVTILRSHSDYSKNRHYCKNRYWLQQALPVSSSE